MKTKTRKIYAEVLEDLALEQFNDAMSLDCVTRGALMPDAHAGYSLPIGSVVETDGMIFPSWVGYDIGCGMCAVKTSFNKSDVISNGDKIFKKILEYVPVGFSKQSSHIAMPLLRENLTIRGQEAFDKRDGVRNLGTLGGGNHFIEIGYDENDNVWIVIHSGSRGVGHGIAETYMKLASANSDIFGEDFDERNKDFKLHNSEKYEVARQKYIDKMVSKAKAKEGHYGFVIDSDLGRDYLNDLNWSLNFALENRLQMISQVALAISFFCEGEIDSANLINRNHNHAEVKDGMVIHRKGATHAEDGMMGVIPGNMRDGSFIVRGKGNEDSLCSSSHGAGRVMSRKKAKNTIDLDEFVDTMGDIVGTIDAKRLDEAPDAYKNIFDVMDAQKDLVDVVAYVKPLINVKG